MDMTIFVVDDHAGFRGCARRVLEAQGFNVVGEAADGAEALAGARKLHPQLALVDVRLPDMSGFELAARLRTLQQPPAILLTSSHDPSELGLPPAGAVRGFIPKERLSRATIEEFL